MLRKMGTLLLSGFIVFAGMGIVNDGVEAKAGSKFEVKLKRCIDGDTAEFTKVGKTRFLYVDTPESTTKKESYGLESSQYTCAKLKSAKKIYLQYDGPKKDKYGRTLAWVWTDKTFLQRELIRRGYVKKFYDYGNYSYEAELVRLQKDAQKRKVGLWSGKKSVADTPVKKPVSGKKYKNCTEMRKDYPNGVKRGHPSYESKHDRDKDGYACEK